MAILKRFSTNIRTFETKKIKFELNKKFFYNIALLVLVNILIKPLWIFGLDRKVQLAVGNEQYGLYYGIFSLAIILNSMLDPGLHQYMNQRFSKVQHRVEHTLMALFQTKLVLSVLYIAALFILALLLNMRGQESVFLFFLAFAQIFSSFQMFLRSLITARQDFMHDILLSVTEKIILILMVAYLLLFTEQFQIIWLAQAQLVAAFVGFMVSVKVFEIGQLPRKIVIDTQFVRQTLKNVLPFASLFLFMGIYYRVDVLMLRYLLPNGQYHTGIYAQALRILDGLSALAYLVASFLLPKFSNMLSQKQSVRKLSFTAFAVLIIPALVVLVLAVCFSTEVVQVLYHTTNHYAVQTFRVLLMAFPAVASNYVFGTLLTAQGRLKLLNVLALGAMLLNLSFNALVIPYFQAPGAAWVSVVTHYFMAILQAYFALKTLRVNAK